MIKKSVRHHLEHYTRLESFFYQRPLHKVPAFVGTFVILLFLMPTLLKSFEWSSYVSFFLVFALDLYLLFFVVFIIRHSVRSLLSAQNIWRLLGSYFLFILSVLLLFSFAYKSMEGLDRGYLTYGKCSDHFNPGMIESDSSKSTDYFYFSTVTLFTVGYGDICPMGWNKGLALVNSFVGNFISVVLMVIVISTYIHRSSINKKLK
jgi:potassium channel LctB